MLSRDASEPLVETAVAELDDSVAARADHVVMVLVAADAVAELAAAVGQGVHDSRGRERREGAVHRREADPLASFSQPSVQLLGGRVVALASKLREDEDAAARGADPGFLEAASCCRGRDRHTGMVRMR